MFHESVQLIQVLRQQAMPAAHNCRLAGLQQSLPGLPLLSCSSAATTIERLGPDLKCQFGHPCTMIIFKFYKFQPALVVLQEKTGWICSSRRLSSLQQSALQGYRAQCNSCMRSICWYIHCLVDSLVELAEVSCCSAGHEGAAAAGNAAPKHRAAQLLLAIP